MSILNYFSQTSTAGDDCDHLSENAGQNTDLHSYSFQRIAAITDSIENLLRELKALLWYPANTDNYIINPL